MQARFATFVNVILKLVPLHGNCVKQNDWMSNEQGLDSQTCHAICGPITTAHFRTCTNSDISYSSNFTLQSPVRKAGNLATFMCRLS